MKFRVTFLDNVDLLIEADKEIDAVRKARELKDKLSVVNTDYNRYENETDKEFLKSAISEMRKYVSNWNFMSEREKKDITGGQGIRFLRESLKSAEDRLKKLS